MALHHHSDAEAKAIRKKKKKASTNSNLGKRLAARRKAAGITY